MMNHNSNRHFEDPVAAYTHLAPHYADLSSRPLKQFLCDHMPVECTGTCPWCNRGWGQHFISVTTSKRMSGRMWPRALVFVGRNARDQRKKKGGRNDRPPS